MLVLVLILISSVCMRVCQFIYTRVKVIGQCHSLCYSAVTLDSAHQLNSARGGRVPRKRRKLSKGNETPVWLHFVVVPKCDSHGFKTELCLWKYWQVGDTQSGWEMHPGFLLLLCTHTGLLETLNNHIVILWELRDVYETNVRWWGLKGFRFMFTFTIGK